MKNINNEKGFVSKLVLIIIILLLLFDAIALENKIINKVKSFTPIIIESTSTFLKENITDTDKDTKTENNKENFDKEDIRYTKNCKEIVEDMGMGDKLLGEGNKKMKIRYHQTNGEDLMIIISKEGDCSIEEV